MGKRKLRLKVERKKPEYIIRPKGRPTKKGTKRYGDYKQRVSGILYGHGYLK